MLVLSAPSGGIPPIALVSHAGYSAGGSGGTTGAIDTTGPNLIVLSSTGFQTSAVSVSDSESNAWTLIQFQINAEDNAGIALWYCSNPTTSATHTFTCSGVVPVL